ncbi:DUF2937 family protein [Enterovirga rhinocerotis]|uniref:DUF2937 family protein n=1 Tax=Enterovirga rhinocerotis TaxID=1339210 RepID=A0A4R7BWM7_9HYPH|nr:DUF2937 family protein [Enterovirga rhinocerotis]TDR89903.1 DUF2937 family protein [Enterovirga rhinocerotis]
MIGRILALVIGLFSGLAGAQMPEFAQQYRQRLGGAIDELRRVVVRFDDTAQAHGLTREAALKRLGEDASPVVQGQARATEEVIARLARLEDQKRKFAEEGSFGRLVTFVREADPGLARATYLDYEPAWPATQEGLIMGGAGFATGWGLLIFLSRIARRLNPFRRRQPSLRSA